MKPEIKVSMDWEGYDKLFLDMLLEGYETSYWTLLDTKKRLEFDPKKNAYMNEDYWNTLKVLDAFEVLANHYTAREDHLRMLADIRDRMNAKAKIAKGMSQS